MHLNYYKDNVYTYSGTNQSDLNPYLKLIRDFVNFPSLAFKAADFTYLCDLGLYPVNRLWVLRRFADFVTVPNNLQGLGIKPISTVVGWIDPSEESFFDISFNEKWTTMNERLDQVVMKILQEEFGFNAENVISLPGWSQGLMFGFLQAMGLANGGMAGSTGDNFNTKTYDLTTVPQGNPAVLGEAATRAKDSTPEYGQESSMNLTLKTSYEQKFVGDIDPGAAFLDIIENLTRMGTRETLYIFTGSSGILEALRNANSTGTVENWWTFIKTLLDGFITAIGTIFTEISKQFSSLKLTETKSSESLVNTNGVNVITDLVKGVSSIGEGFLQSVLASTVSKWRFALAGSIGVMTGESTTPWHITLGNPSSPTVSLSNVKITSVEVKLKNEMGFNDMPTKIDVTINVSLGRNLGAQEIFSMFNNGYQRSYSGNSSLNSQTQTAEQQAEQTKQAQDAITKANLNAARDNKIAQGGNFLGQ